MNPVNQASCRLTLVQDVESTAAGNLCHLSGTQPNIQDCVEFYAAHIFQPGSWDLICLPKIKFVIFKQRVSSSVLPPLTEEAPLFVFCPPIQQNAQDTIKWVHIANPSNNGQWHHLGIKIRTFVYLILIYQVGCTKKITICPGKNYQAVQQLTMTPLRNKYTLKHVSNTDLSCGCAIM